MKVKILKNYKDYRKNQIIEVTKNVAFGLIDKKIARLFASFKNVNKMFKKSKAKMK